MDDTISRQAAIDALHMHLMYRMGTDSNKKRLDEWINNLPSAQPEQQWIPCSERLPEREKTGCSNWHTKSVLVCAYGNACTDGYEYFDYEILMGYFIEMEDEETGQKSLCFEPDNRTLFIPEEWDFLDLDEDFKCHMSIDECTFYTDETLTQTEFHDKYIQILAWMPLPKPYKEGDTK